MLTAQPETLLSTIRSRTQRLRFAALPDAMVTELLVAGGVDATRAKEAARLAGGSVETGALLADPDLSVARDAFVARAIEALDAPDLGPALELADDAKKQKDALPERLGAFAVALAARATRGAAGGGPEADRDAARYSLALAAMSQLDGNAAPQLVIESMLARMRSV